MNDNSTWNYLIWGIIGILAGYLWENQIKISTTLTNIEKHLIHIEERLNK